MNGVKTYKNKGGGSV